MNDKKNLLNLVPKDDSFNSVVLGETIRLLRERNNLTQNQLGECASVSTAEISKIEKGSRKKIPIDTLIRICPHLNVSIDYLLAACIPNCTSSDHEHFYDYTGNEIDLYNIARNLYSTDSELLLLLSTYEFLSDKNFIKFIKLWLKTQNHLKQFMDTNSSNILNRLFESLIKYCTDFLRSIYNATNQKCITKEKGGLTNVY